MKVIVTGGSGFIGTNFIDLLENKSCEILNIDIKKPQKKSHLKYFECIDINDFSSLKNAIKNFQPEFIVHLAARTDLDGKDIYEYSANTKGVSNILKCCENLLSIKRIILASTKLIAPTNSEVSDLHSYNPDTVYGESKVQGEIIVEENKYFDNWIIVRPTSIWGPWSLSEHIPYGRFFQVIKKGLYIHPAVADQPRYFGYVENSCFQIFYLMINTSDDVLRNKFYLADYKVYDIKGWANLISKSFGRNKVKVLPKVLVYLAAFFGDLLKLFGYKNPPFSSFRLKNMQADTTKIPLESTKNYVPNLPYSIEEGTEKTCKWIDRYG